MFRHVVLFRVRGDLSDSDVLAAITALGTLGEHPGVLSWDVAVSLDSRKGRVILEDGAFADRAAFDMWRASDRHRAVGERMARISDWWVGDWERY